MDTNLALYCREMELVKGLAGWLEVKVEAWMKTTEVFLGEQSDEMDK